MSARHPHLTELERDERERRRRDTPARRVDVPAFVATVKALPVFRDCPRSLTTTKVVVVHTAHASGGVADGSRMARVRVAPSTTVQWLLSTIVHELVHCALPEGTGHDERFRRTLCRAARELWAIDVPPNAPAGRTGRYAVDDLIERELEVRLTAGTVSYPVKLCPEPGATAAADKAAALSARRASIKAKRAAHARAMHSRWRARLRRAERLVAKWQAKVRYYDRTLKDTP